MGRPHRRIIATLHDTTQALGYLAARGRIVSRRRLAQLSAVGQLGQRLGRTGQWVYTTAELAAYVAAPDSSSAHAGALIRVRRPRVDHLLDAATARDYLAARGRPLTRERLRQLSVGGRLGARLGGTGRWVYTTVELNRFSGRGTGSDEGRGGYRR